MLCLASHMVGRARIIGQPSIAAAIRKKRRLKPVLFQGQTVGAKDAVDYSLFCLSGNAEFILKNRNQRLTGKKNFHGLLPTGTPVSTQGLDFVRNTGFLPTVMVRARAIQADGSLVAGIGRPQRGGRRSRRFSSHDAQR